MAKRASFLYEALGAKSRGGSSPRFSKQAKFGRSAHRMTRSAAGAGSGAFAWVSNLFGGRRRRRSDTGPLLMAVGAALGLLAVGFLIGRFVGDGAQGAGPSLDSSRPSYLMTEEELTTPDSDFGAILLGWNDSAENRDTALAVGMDLQDELPRLRVLKVEIRGQDRLLLVCHVDDLESPEAGKVLRMVQRLPNPHRLIDQALWDSWAPKRGAQIYELF